VNEPQTQPAGGRLPAIDLWRGLVVVIMALDHAAHFLGQHAGLEMAGRNQPGFRSFWPWFTRFLTHYCAPSFVFLAGASVVMLAVARRARGQNGWRISGHLLVRGALLVVLEYTVVTGGWGHGFEVFQVIGCLGACIALGSGLRLLPATVALVLGVLLLFGHPLLADPEVTPAVKLLGPTWRGFLLEPGFFTRWPVLYPVLPWLSVFLLGIAFGHCLVRDRERTLRWSWLLGLLGIALFVVLRLTAGFATLVQEWSGDQVQSLGNLTPQMLPEGDARPRPYWFFAMSKYPPAADFILWNVGGGLLFCWFAARARLGSGRWAAPLMWPGRAALFFYLIHLYVYRWLAELTRARNGGFLAESLTSAWLLWLMGLPLLLPLCWWYGRLKRRFPGFPLDLL
jgi:uncharacterized membrane protein